MHFFLICRSPAGRREARAKTVPLVRSGVTLARGMAVRRQVDAVFHAWRYSGGIRGTNAMVVSKNPRQTRWMAQICCLPATMPTGCVGSAGPTRAVGMITWLHSEKRALCASAQQKSLRVPDTQVGTCGGLNRLRELTVADHSPLQAYSRWTFRQR